MTTDNRLQSAVSLTLPFGGDAQSAFSLAPGLTHTVNPNFTLSILQSAEFTRGILRRVGLQTFRELLEKGWPRIFLLSMLVEKIEWITKENSQETRNYINDPDDQECFFAFQDAVDILVKGNMHFKSGQSPKPISPNLTSADTELLKALIEAHKVKAHVKPEETNQKAADLGQAVRTNSVSSQNGSNSPSPTTFRLYVDETNTMIIFTKWRRLLDGNPDDDCYRVKVDKTKKAEHIQQFLFSLQDQAKQSFDAYDVLGTIVGGKEGAEQGVSNEKEEPVNTDNEIGKSKRNQSGKGSSQSETNRAKTNQNANKSVDIKKDKVTLFLRSPQGVVHYFGEVARAIEGGFVPQIEARKKAAGEPIAESKSEPLFLVKKGQATGPTFVSVRYRGNRYYVPTGVGAEGLRLEGRSLQAFALTLQLIGLQKTAKDLEVGRPVLTISAD